MSSRIMRRLSVAATLILLSVTAPSSLQAQITAVTGDLVHARVGHAIDPGVQVKLVIGNDAVAGASLHARVVESGARASGSTVVATDSSGVARFDGLTISGRAGAYKLRVSTADGSVSRDLNLVLAVGDKAALRVICNERLYGDACGSRPQQRARLARDGGSSEGELPADRALNPAPMVRLMDSSGNAVRESGVPVTASLGSGAGELEGSTEVKTDAQGIATFSNLAVHGAAGLYSISFSAASVRSDTSNPIPIADASFNSHLIIGAIKTVSGQKPDAEFLDLNFVFPISLDEADESHLGVFAIATVDVALTPEQVQLVDTANVFGIDSATASGDSAVAVVTGGRKLQEGSFSLNFMMPNPNSGARKAFAGLGTRIFGGNFGIDYHVGMIELPSSALHGSYFVVGYHKRFQDLSETFEQDGFEKRRGLGRDNIFVSFLARSARAPFLSSLAIRGTIMVPLGLDETQIESRIVLSVPFADLFQISTGH